MRKIQSYKTSLNIKGFGGANSLLRGYSKHELCKKAISVFQQ